MCDGTNDRLTAVEDTVRELLEACREIQAGLAVLVPSVPGLGEGLQGLAALLRGEAPLGDVRARSVTILNGLGQAVACLSAAEDGSGGLQISDSRGRPVASLQTVGGAGRLALVRPDAGRVIAFTPTEVSSSAGEAQ